MFCFRLLFVYLRFEICIRIFESQKLSLNCYGFYVPVNVCVCPVAAVAVVVVVDATVARVYCGRCCKSKCLNWAQGNDLHNNFYQFYMYIFRKTTINYPTIFPKYKIYDLYDFRWYSDCASATRFSLSLSSITRIWPKRNPTAFHILITRVECVCVQPWDKMTQRFDTITKMMLLFLCWLVKRNCFLRRHIKRKWQKKRIEKNLSLAIIFSASPHLKFINW